MKTYHPTLDILERRDCPSMLAPVVPAAPPSNATIQPVQTAQPVSPPPLTAIFTEHPATPAVYDQWAAQAQHDYGVIDVQAQPQYEQADWQDSSGTWQEQRSYDYSATWTAPIPDTQFVAVEGVVSNGTLYVFASAGGPGPGMGVHVTGATSLTVSQSQGLLAAGLDGNGLQSAAWVDQNAAWQPNQSQPLFAAPLSTAPSMTVEAPANWTVGILIVTQQQAAAAGAAQGASPWAVAIAQYYAQQNQSL